MAYGLSNGQVTLKGAVCEAVRSAILAIAWLLVSWWHSAVDADH